ncbi:hypothetical protein D3C85_733790 [compost metagenome]
MLIRVKPQPLVVRADEDSMADLFHSYNNIDQKASTIHITPAISIKEVNVILLFAMILE